MSWLHSWQTHLLREYKNYEPNIVVCGPRAESETLAVHVFEIAASVSLKAFEENNVQALNLF